MVKITRNKYGHDHTHNPPKSWSNTEEFGSNLSKDEAIALIADRYAELARGVEMSNWHGYVHEGQIQMSLDQNGGYARNNEDFSIIDDDGNTVTVSREEWHSAKKSALDRYVFRMNIEHTKESTAITYGKNAAKFRVFHESVDDVKRKYAGWNIDQVIPLKQNGEYLVSHETISHVTSLTDARVALDVLMEDVKRQYSKNSPEQPAPQENLTIVQVREEYDNTCTSPRLENWARNISRDYAIEMIAEHYAELSDGNKWSKWVGRVDGEQITLSSNSHGGFVTNSEHYKIIDSEGNPVEINRDEWYNAVKDAFESYGAKPDKSDLKSIVAEFLDKVDNQDTAEIANALAELEEFTKSL